MDARYIIDAIVALEKAEVMLVGACQAAPSDRGRLSAECYCAASALRIHSGIGRAQVKVDLAGSAGTKG